MRPALLLPLFLAWLSPVWAQSPAATTPQPLDGVSAQAGLEQRAERIQIEDSGARIDELRIGGETRTITVLPKGGMPAYDVQPGSGARSWKILGF